MMWAAEQLNEMAIEELLTQVSLRGQSTGLDSTSAPLYGLTTKHCRVGYLSI